MRNVRATRYEERIKKLTDENNTYGIYIEIFNFLLYYYIIICIITREYRFAYIPEARYTRVFHRIAI